MNKILVICGATATGKTKLAVDCAKKLNSEVISADSLLIYKGLNIGTAKPTADEMGGIKHHMIDIVDAREKFSVCDYLQAALPIVENLVGEGKIPVICGGTGFYINSLLFQLGYGNAAANAEIREKYIRFSEEFGNQALYEKLKEVDPRTAINLHYNDTKRIIRALEIYESTGKRKSEQDDKMIPRFNYVAVAINYPREELYARIDDRVDEMFSKGLVDEVKELLTGGIDESFQCMQAIGYKEVVASLNKGYLDSTVCDIIRLNTRHYAKRQITFFKKLPNIHWLMPEDANADKITELLNE